MEYLATISSKNQITLPADVRRRLGLRAVDKVAIVVTDDGQVTLRPAAYDLESILNAIPALPGESLDLDAEIEAATADAIERRFGAGQA